MQAWLRWSIPVFPFQVLGHRSVFINPPRLADFKQVLNKAGLQVCGVFYRVHVKWPPTYIVTSNTHQCIPTARVQLIQLRNAKLLGVHLITGK